MVRKRDNLYAAERQFLLKEISLPEDYKNSEGERVKVQALFSFFFLCYCWSWKLKKLSSVWICLGGNMCWQFWLKKKSDIAIFGFHHVAFQPEIVLIIVGDSVFVSKW